MSSVFIFSVGNLLFSLTQHKYPDNHRAVPQELVEFSFSSFVSMSHDGDVPSPIHRSSCTKPWVVGSTEVWRLHLKQLHSLFKPLFKLQKQESRDLCRCWLLSLDRSRQLTGCWLQQTPVRLPSPYVWWWDISLMLFFKTYCLCVKFTAPRIRPWIYVWLYVIMSPLNP